MINRHRNSRIGIRCTEMETKAINQLALDLDMSVADLIRGAVVIAYKFAQSRRHWDQMLTTAIAMKGEKAPWNIS